MTEHARELEPLRELVEKRWEQAATQAEGMGISYKIQGKVLRECAREVKALLPSLDSALTARDVQPDQSAQDLAKQIAMSCVLPSYSTNPNEAKAIVDVIKIAALIESFGQSRHAAVAETSKCDCIVCPECSGKGTHRVEDRTQPEGYDRETCDECRGSGFSCICCSCQIADNDDSFDLFLGGM